MTEPFDDYDVPVHSTEGDLLGMWGLRSQASYAVEKRLRDNRIRMERIRNLHIVATTEEQA
jgi:hypothetical protein